MKRTKAVLILCGMLLGPLSAMEARSEPSVRFEQRLGASIPKDVVFRGETGELTSLGKILDGKPAILNLVYYGCPNLCTWVLNGLVHSMKELPLNLGTQYQVVSISIDPRERPPLALAKKRSYLAKYGISEVAHPKRAQGWRFLTGDRSSIDRIAEAVGFHYHRDAVTGQYSHPSGIVVVSSAGKISRYFFGATYPSQELAAALSSARRGTIGALVKDFLLLCADYDPATSPVGHWVLRIIRFAAIFCATSLLVMLIWLFRQERKA